MKILFLAVVCSLTAAIPNVVSDQAELETCPQDVLFKEEATLEEGHTLNSARLPTSLRPIHYTLRLQPFINGNLSIHGSVDIRFKVVEPTDKVVLNMADIITRNESVTVEAEGAAGERIRVVCQTYDSLLQLYTAHLEQRLLPTTTYLFHMDFQGYLNDKLVGFYRSEYKDAQGTHRMLAATQFSPTDARRAFPCFDEPSFKATFDVHLARQTNMTALSNMPLISTQPIAGQDGWVWDSFNTTLPMSTYLVGFLISDFSYLESSQLNHTVMRVWTRKDALDQGTYVRDMTPTVLTYLEDYFGLPFPLPKLDMASVPDFKFSGMENWGLILYRETALLYDPQKTPVSSKQDLGITVAHEISHQWFGNLVTPAWWSDLWLKEGFATFMGYVGLNVAEPSWGMMDQFLTNNLHYAMALDSLQSSHPINVPVNHPDEISQIFDAISYRKGASIIRMMQNFLSENTFRRGLTNYLTALQYSNAEQDDLWHHLTQAAHVDGTLPDNLSVKAIMDSWTLKMGYPVITVKRNGTTAVLTQEWFQLRGANKNVSNPPGWWVPISYTTQNNPDFQQTNAQFWMSQDRKPLEITGLPDQTKWLLVNLQQTGYYRVNYDSTTWQLLTNQLTTDHMAIHLANRAQLLNDAFNLARAGELDYQTALAVSTYLVKERDFVPWSSALSSLYYLFSMFERAGGYGALRGYLLSLVVPLYDSVGFYDHPADTHLTQYKRVITTKFACKLGHRPCVDNATNLFSTWINSPGNQSVLPVSVLGTVTCTGVARGGEMEWNATWKRYTQSNVGSERVTLLSSLGCTKEMWILSRYLEMAFTPGSGVRKQDASKVFTAVARNTVGRDLAWNYLQDQWPNVLEYFGPGSGHLSSLIKSVGKIFNTQLELKELEKFQADNAGQLGSATRALEQSLEAARLNVAWMSRSYNTILEWLREKGYNHEL